MQVRVVERLEPSNINRPKAYRIVRLIAAIAAVALMVGTFIENHRPAPTFGSVAGTYYNPCCLPVRIENGYFRYGDAQTRLKLVNDKFGLQGWLDQPIGPFYFMDGNDRKPAVLGFTRRGAFEVADASEKDHLFTRVDTGTSSEAHSH